MRGGEPLDERRASPSGFRRRFLLFAASCSLTPGDAAMGWVGPGGAREGGVQKHWGAPRTPEAQLA